MPSGGMITPTGWVTVEEPKGGHRKNQVWTLTRPL